MSSAVYNQDYAAIEKIYKASVAQCTNLSGEEFRLCQERASGIAAMAAKRIPQFADGGIVTNGERSMMAPNTTTTEAAKNKFMAAFQKPKMFADGGEVDMSPMPMGVDIALLSPAMSQEESEMDMMEKINTVLDSEEKNILNMAMEDYPQLEIILDKVTAVSDEFTGEGPVAGPGTETSDSIPARLSDGEFVFTAKAVKQIGVDKLRKMMDKAEAEYDASMASQEAAMMEDEEVGGFFLGGLLDKARKFWGNQDSATATYQQEQKLEMPQRTNGMGRQVPRGEQGIMSSKEVDLTQGQRSSMLRPVPETNTNRQSMAPISTTALGGQTPRANLTTEQGRQQMNQRLTQATKEPEQSLMMP